MNTLNLNRKIIGGFILIATMIFVGGLTGWYGIWRISHELDNISQTRYQSIYNVGVIAEKQQIIQRLESSLLIPESFSNESDRSRLLTILEGTWNDAEKANKTYDSINHTETEKAIWQEAKSSWNVWKKNHMEIVQLVKDGKRNEALAISRGKGKESNDRVSTLLRNLSELNLKDAEAAKKLGERESSRQKWLATTIPIFGILLAIIFGLFATRSLKESTHNIFKELSTAGLQFAATSGQIASSSQQLAQGTASQAQSTQEASVAMDELVKLVSQSEHDVDQLKKGREATNESGMVAFDFLAKANRSIKQIKQSSEEAGKMIKTINEVAFQTNLLSLTASVEAARTGAAGTGFAIVAEEVKNLATHSTEAVKNTSDCIEQTIRHIDRGRELVRASLSKFIEYGNTGQELENHIVSAKEVSQNQSRGIEQINASIQEISRMAQDNAASAQEAASVAQQISAQAESMQEIVEEMAKTV